MPFSIDSDDIARLQPAEFVDLLSHLLFAEAERVGLPRTNVDTTLRLNDPDGGIDARVNDVGEPGTDWLPPGESIWQFRAGKQTAAKVKKELEKSAVRSALQRGAYWRLACGHDHTPRDVETLREAATTWCDANGIPPGLCNVYSASHLAEWARDIPAFALLPHFRRPHADLQRHEFWSRQEAHRVAFQSDAMREGAMQDIGTWLDDPTSRASFRIEGGAGVGKTRLALEALRDTSWTERTLYADQPDALRNSGTLTWIQNRQNSTVALVVDECDLAESERLEGWASACGSRVKLITIGTDPETVTSTPVVSVTKLDDECLRQLLRSIGGLTDEAVEYVVRMAEGYVKLAVCLARLLRAQPQAATAELIRDGSVRKLLRALIPDDADRRAMQGLALLRRVGMEGEIAEEGRQIAGFLHIDFAAMQQAGRRMHEHQVLAPRGRYRYVTPTILAVWLAREVWDERAAEIMNVFFWSLPSNDSRTSLLRRLADIGDEDYARGLIERLTAPGGPLAEAHQLDDEFAAELLGILAQGAPQAGMRALQRLIGGLPRDDLLAFKKGRRQVVWTLQRLARFPETFFAAAQMLLKLAEAENESYGNNASGVWVSLFQTHLSRTPEPAIVRHELIREALRNPSAEQRHLAVRAIGAALQTYEVGSVVGDVQGGRAVPVAWSPTPQEDLEARQSALNLLDEAMSSDDTEIARLARDTLLKHWMQLCRVGFAADVLPRIEGLTFDTEAQRLRARNEAEMLLTLADEGTSEGFRRRLERLLARLEGRSFGDRLRRWTAALSSRDQQDAEIDALAQEAMERPELLLAEIDWLTSGEAHYAGRLGWVIGRIDENLTWLRPLAQVTGGGDARLFTHYLGGASEHRGREWLEDLLDQWDTAPGLPPAVAVSASIAYTPSSRAAQRLTALVEKGKAPLEWLTQVCFSPWIADAPRSAFSEVVGLMLAAENPIVVGSAFEVVKQRRDRGNDTPKLVNDLVWRCVEARPDCVFQGTMNRYHWSELAESVLAEDPVRVVRAFIMAATGDHVYLFPEDAVTQTLVHATTRAPREVWNLIACHLQGDGALLSLLFGLRGWYGKHVGAEVLVEWAASHEPNGPSLAALMSPVGGVPLADPARAILVAFDCDRVRNELQANFLSGLHMGNTSDWLLSKLALVEQWVDDPEPSVRDWAMTLQEPIEADIRMWRRDEEERDW
jgi:hypothetical protein